MAENAAFITASSFIKPSIFEVIAKENLASMFYPALKQCVFYLSSRNSKFFGWTFSSFDELYVIFDTLLHYYYLDTFDSTFSERFYNLKRVKINALNNQERLSSTVKIVLVFIEVIVPYLWKKYLPLLEQQCNESTHSETVGQRQLKNCFLKLLQVSSIVFEGLSLLNYVAYISGRSQSHSILLKFANITLINKMEVTPESNWMTHGQIFFDKRLSVFNFLSSIINGFLTHSLEICVFFLQFLRWWESEKLYLKLIPNPVPESPCQNSAKKFSHKCPLCLQTRKIDTVLPISGYIFCYLCIHRTLLETGRCPITNLPASSSDLIRLYIGNH